MNAERVLSQLAFGQLWKRTVPEARHDEVSQRFLQFNSCLANPLRCLSVRHQLLVGVECYAIKFAVRDWISFIPPGTNVSVEFLVKCPRLNRLRMARYRRRQSCFECSDIFSSR